MRVLRKLAQNDRPEHFSVQLRQKRFALFLAFLSQLPRPLKILDVGGTETFWQTMHFTPSDQVEITLLNLHAQLATDSHFKILSGNACSMPQFRENEFDVVFSNSVIEHVGNFEAQQKMAHEVQRVGKCYFIQTPNYYFPIEPHFLFPAYHWLPLELRIWLLRHWNLGWLQKTPDPIQAKQKVESIQLLTPKQFRKLFPAAEIYYEKFWGLNKSMIVHGGWNPQENAPAGADKSWT